MKIIYYVILAALLTLNARAEALGFVKVGKTYKVVFANGASVELEVLSDAGDGWYECRTADDPRPDFMNFNLAIGITPKAERVSAVEPPPITAEPARAAASSSSRAPDTHG